jgi:hypothetical protein
MRALMDAMIFGKVVTDQSLKADIVNPLNAYPGRSDPTDTRSNEARCGARQVRRFGTTRIGTRQKLTKGQDRRR